MSGATGMSGAPGHALLDPAANLLPEGSVTLLTYDGKTLTLPASAAIHSRRLREKIVEGGGTVADGSAISLTSNPNLVRAAVLYAVAYLKLCDAMSGLPGSGYSIGTNGVNLVSVHLPSIFSYLGRGTTRLPWEQTLSSYSTSIGSLSDNLLVQLMHTAEFLELRGMRDTAVLQIAMRIEKGAEEDKKALAILGDDTLMRALIAMSTEYMATDEEMALQFVRALAVLVPLGFGCEIRTFHVLTMPEVACCYPLEKETSCALLLITEKLSPENVLKHYIMLWDNLDPAVRRFGLRTFLSLEISQWTPSCIQAVLSRLTHGHSDRRCEAMKAVRKLGLQNVDLPESILSELLRAAIADADPAGAIARKMIKDQVRACFLRDDDGQV